MQMRLAVLTLMSLALAQKGWSQKPTYTAVEDAQRDTAVSTIEGGMLSIPGVGDDFVRAGGGQFVEFADGTARLTERVFSLSNLYAAFLVDITFTGRVEPGSPNHPPAGAPEQLLLPAAYAPTGAIDPADFRYYTGATGTLTGVRNLDGAIVTLTSIAPTQLGNGANNRNANAGLQARFGVAVVQHPFGGLTPTGDATLVLDFVASYDETTTHPQANSSLTSLPAGRAFTLPGIANDYVFVPDGVFREQADGTASIQGTLASLSDLADSWDLVLNLTGRIDPGESNYPPAGSPVLQMLPTAYAAGGGTLDPSHWHYYTTATGTLTGKRLNAGGIIDLTATTALQVGGGANQTNSYFGFYAAFTPAVATQPTGRMLTPTGDAEVFGLTAVFPVLPFPSLTPPAATPTLPTVTDQGLVIEGENLAWVEQVAVQDYVVIAGNADDWYDGYFHVIDNQHIEVHPRPGAIPVPTTCWSTTPRSKAT